MRASVYKRAFMFHWIAIKVKLLYFIIISLLAYLYINTFMSKLLRLGMLPNVHQNIQVPLHYFVFIFLSHYHITFTEYDLLVYLYSYG